MGTLLLQPVLGATSPALYSSTLTWDRSPDNSVTGYRIYYGTSPRNYATSVIVGNALRATVGGLTNGIAYYFAVTAYDASGAESDFSNEVQIVPGQLRVGLRVSPSKQAVLTISGLVGHSYDILASTNLTSWSVIGTAALTANPTQDFTDTNAANFPKRFYRTRDNTPNATTAPAPAQATVTILSASLQRAVLSVTGVPGQLYDLQATSDSASWITLTRLFLDPTGNQIYLDRTWRPDHNRAYRAVAVTP